MLNLKRTKLVVLSTISISFLSACVGAGAGLIIKTWFLDANEAALIRRDQNGEIKERRELKEADGYRCYSREDDESWRKDFDSLAACCSAKQ